MTANKPSKQASKEYFIVKLSDIFDIPENSFDDFMIDLKAFYKVGRNMTTIGKIAEPNMPPSKMLKGTEMIWIDDGKHDLKKVTIQPVKKGKN